MEGASVRREEAHLAWLAPAAVALSTIAVFLPALSVGFVWDDWLTFPANPNFRGLGLKQLGWMFTVSHPYPGAPSSPIPYQPLTWLVHALDYEAWGLNPMGYHLTNLLLHAANALTVYWLSLLLLARGRPAAEDHLGAAVSALFFSVHPLRVEPVAWLSARGHMLSSFFFLLTVQLWLESISRESPPPFWHRLMSWCSYLLALLSRSISVSLPAALVVLDIYPLRRLPGDPRRWASPRLRRVWLEKLPFLTMALSFTLVEFRARRDLLHFAVAAPAGWTARITQPLFALSYYLQKTLVPLKLTPHYVWQWDLTHTPYVFGAACVLALAAVLIIAGRRFPAGLAAFAFFATTLVPMVGVYKPGYETACDRYSYIPCLGWALLAGAGLRRLATARRSNAPGGKFFLPAFAGTAAVLTLLSFQSWRQVQVWQDSIQLWRHALRVDPIDTIARKHLADALLEQRRVSEAVLLLQEQLRLFPEDETTKKALSEIVAKTWGQEPEPGKLYNDAGADLLERGEAARAAWYFRKALQLDPNLSRARDNLELALRAMKAQ